MMTRTLSPPSVISGLRFSSATTTKQNSRELIRVRQPSVNSTPATIASA